VIIYSSCPGNHKWVVGHETKDKT